MAVYNDGMVLRSHMKQIVILPHPNRRGVFLYHCRQIIVNIVSFTVLFFAFQIMLTPKYESPLVAIIGKCNLTLSDMNLFRKDVQIIYFSGVPDVK